MAGLNGNDLGDLLLSTLNTAALATFGDRQALYRALGNAIVNYIKANAVVTIPSVTLVQPGIGSSGPGTGTIA